MYGTLFALCRLLSPRWDAGAGLKVCTRGAGAIPWLRVVPALFVTQALLLACAARMLSSRAITWAGVEYVRSAGRVRVVRRTTLCVATHS